MEYVLTEKDDTLELLIKGSFSFKDEKKFFIVIRKLHESEIKKVIFDLSECTFMDSASLGMLIVAGKEASLRQAKLIILNPNKKIKELLFITKMNEVFEIKELDIEY